MLFLYNTFVSLYTAGIQLAARWNDKARKWTDGRRNWRQEYPQRLGKKDRPVLWMHVASLGEFEQGRPLLEAFRAQHPGWRIVLSFFSPSGYEIRNNYPYADTIVYLPADTPRNARDYIGMAQPDLTVFVKYEFWYHYLNVLAERRVPTLLVSALFREGQPFFRSWGGLWRRMLGCFTHFFVQNEASAQLLERVGFSNVCVAGDTRVDRVLSLAAAAAPNDVVAAFVESHPVFIVGSSWEADEAVYLPVLQQAHFQHYKIIIAPHDPSKAAVSRLATYFRDAGISCVRYSQAKPGSAAAARVLLIDNVGMLNTLYRYGTLAWIGGGFGKGIHNTLEPAAFGLPVIFGPRFEKFEEARQLTARGGAFSVRDSAGFEQVLRRLGDPEARAGASAATVAYIEESRGATDKILAFLSQVLPASAI